MNVPKVLKVKDTSCTMSVTRVVNRGVKFDDCSCASKWVRVSVNGLV